MRSLRKVCLIALMSGLAFAQTNGSNTSSDPSNLADEVKQLREMMAEQQKAMAEQQRRLADQQQEIERLRQQVNPQAQAASANKTDSSPVSAKMVNASLTAPVTTTAVQPVSGRPVQETERKESPLSFRIGGAEFTPGGFMDFTAIFRSTNTGNPGGTNFFSIPFSNTVSGHLTETRFTATNSRLSIKASEKFGKNDVTGYAEMDFLGNDGANVFVTSNSHTFRQRLYWLDLKRDKFEFLAGQSWSWLTPNRNGLSPVPSDIFFSQNMDFNYQVGLTWTRAPQVRFVYHPSENWAMGIAMENPEQFAGQGEVTFPTAFNAQLTNGNNPPQLDQANSAGVPNLHPDFIPKIAYDTSMGGKHFHVEAAGLLTGVRTTNLVAGNFVKHTKEGGGVEAAINLELFKNFHLVSNAFYSDGGGRYIFGMGPDVVALPNAAGTDIALSLVHSGSGIVGFEWQAHPKALIYAYYGGAYVQRNFALDNTAGARPNSFVGFGGPNSANTNNRSIQEPTIGWIQTFWKNPQYGALQLITQASYLTRSPWFVAAGAPKNAHLAMGWVDLRYVLP